MSPLNDSRAPATPDNTIYARFRANRTFLPVARTFMVLFGRYCRARILLA